MAKKIQKKQIEDGVFVETKATYSAPTQDNEFVQKKYVDEEVAKKADISHTHSWTDITNKPRISVTLADTAISRTYTIGLTGANGSSGKLIIPKAVSWNDVTDKPTFPTLPSWVTQTKPTYDWSEIQNKPSFDYLSLTGGTVNGNVNLNGSFLINDKTRVEVRDNGNIAFGNKPFNDLVIGEFKGIQLWGQGNDKVVLAGGGVTNLSELKNENIKVGGRNLMVNSEFVPFDNIATGAGISKINKDSEKITEFHVTSGNGNWSTNNIQPKYIDNTLNEIVSVSFDIKVLEGTLKPPTYYPGSFSPYLNLKPIYGDTIELNKWVRVGVTFVSKTGWQPHLGWSELAGKYQLKNFKIEYGNTPTDWSPAPEDLESEIPQYKTITDAHTFLDKDGSVHFGSGSAISNAPSSHFYEMVGFTHNSKNWGFIIAKNIDEDDKRLYIKQVIGGIYKEWFVLQENTWEKQQHSLYGESLVTTLPSVQREVVIDNGTSRNNLWTDGNELMVGSRNVGGYAKINCNGYKIQGKDDNFVLTAGGNSIHKNILLGKKGYVSDGGTLNQQEHSNSTIFMRSSGNFELSSLENLTSCSFRKVFDGGSVTFSCSGKNIIYTTDNQFNGKKGSTAVVSIYENDCYIDIRNI